MFMEKMCGNLSHDSELHLIDRKCKSGYSWPTRELDYARAVSSRFKSRLFSLIEWAGRQAIFKAINRKNPIQGPPPPPPENANVEVPLAMTNTLQVRSSKRNGLVSLRARIASIKFQSVSFPLPNTTSPSQLVTQLLNLVKLYCSVCEIVVNPDRNGIYHCSGPIGGKGCQESWGKPKKLEWRLATPEFQLCSVRSMITRNPPLNAVKVPLGVFERVVGISPKDFMEAVWADADARIKAEVDEVLLSQPLIEGDDEEEKNGSVKESSVPPSNATLAIAEEFGRKCNGLINNDTFFKFILRIRREQDIHGFLSSQRIEIVNMENTE